MSQGLSKERNARGFCLGVCERQRCLHSLRLRWNIPFLLVDPAVQCLWPATDTHTHKKPHAQMAATCALRTLLCHPLESLLVTYGLWWLEHSTARYTDRMLPEATITALLILYVNGSIYILGLCLWRFSNEALNVWLQILWHHSYIFVPKPSANMAMIPIWLVPTGLHHNADFVGSFWCQIACAVEKKRDWCVTVMHDSEAAVIVAETLKLI